MSSGYLFAFLLGSYIFGALTLDSSGCIPSASRELDSCTANAKSFFSDMGNRSQGSFDFMKIICSETGRRVVGCSFGVFAMCPALLTIGPRTLGLDMTSLFPFNMTEMMGEGSIDKYCDSMKTISDCPEMMTCYEKAPKNVTNMVDNLNFTRYLTDATAFNEAKTYLFFQQMLIMYCGPYKPMLDCMAAIKGQCVDMIKQYTKQVDSMMKQAASSVQGVKLKVMTFDDMINMVSTCHLMPKGFGSNKCLQKQLMSREFTACHQNFSATYNTSAKRQNCNAYAALEGCFINDVEPKCGVNTTDVMVRNIPLMVDGLSRSSCETSGSSKPLVTSIMIMMAALFSAMATLL